MNESKSLTSHIYLLQGHGYWLIYPAEPTGPSANPKDGYVFMKPNEAFRTPFKRFINNVAHSSKKVSANIPSTVQQHIFSSLCKTQIIYFTRHRLFVTLEILLAPGDF